MATIGPDGQVYYRVTGPDSLKGIHDRPWPVLRRDYAEHAAINLGQMVRDILDLFKPLPDAVAEGVEIAASGSKRRLWGFSDRVPHIFANFWYSLLPPWWHDPEGIMENLEGEASKRSLLDWFRDGFRWNKPGQLH
jgi:hypothetical protein